MTETNDVKDEEEVTILRKNVVSISRQQVRTQNELLRTLAQITERDERIAMLERVIYECVSYRDIYNSQALTEELYNELLDKFEVDENSKPKC